MNAPGTMNVRIWLGATLLLLACAAVHVGVAYRGISCDDALLLALNGHSILAERPVQGVWSMGGLKSEPTRLWFTKRYWTMLASYAVLTQLFGLREQVLLVFSLAWYLVAGWWLLRSARNNLPPTYAWLALTVYATSPVILETAISGMSESIMIVLVALLGWRLGVAPATWRNLGVVLGLLYLGYLTNPVFLTVIAAAVVVLLWRYRGRGLIGLLVLYVACVPLSNGLQNLAGTAQYRGTALFTELSVMNSDVRLLLNRDTANDYAQFRGGAATGAETSFAHRGEQLLLRMSGNMRNYLQMIGKNMLALFALVLFLPLLDPEFRTKYAGVYLFIVPGLILTVAGTSVLKDATARRIVIFLPWLILLAVQALRAVALRVPGRLQTVVIIGLIAGLLLPGLWLERRLAYRNGFVFLSGKYTDGRFPAWLAATAGPGAAFVSDIPWDVAFYAQRSAAWLPPTLADLERHNRRDAAVKVEYILLSDFVVQPFYEQFWRDVYRDRPERLGGFRWQETMTIDGRNYVLYRTATDTDASHD